MSKYIKIESDGSRTLMNRPNWYTEHGVPVSDAYLKEKENMYPIIDTLKDLNKEDIISIEEKDINEWDILENYAVRTYKIVKDDVPTGEKYDQFHQKLELKDEAS